MGLHFTQKEWFNKCNVMLHAVLRINMRQIPVVKVCSNRKL